MAIDRLMRAVELHPESAVTHRQLGEAHEQLGDLAAAAACYQRALSLKADSAHIHCCLARVLYRGGVLQPAAELYQRALKLDPNNHQIYNDLGLVLTDLGNFGAATEAFRRALILKRDSAQVRASLGYLFERKGDLISAADAYRDAIRHDPNLTAAYADLGFVLYGLGEISEASNCYRRLQRLQPDSAIAAANLAMIHLLEGNLPLAWREYESRWRVGVGDDRKLTQPRWNGEPLSGARILVYAEQGFGDTLQFVRYVPLVAALGGQVVLEVQPPLRRLLEGIAGAVQVISRGERLPDCAWQCPLLSLPMVFSTEMKTIPAKTPYLFAEPPLAKAWRDRLATPAPRVGIVWGGNPGHHRDRLRSVPLDLLVPLTEIPGVTFYSLQVGAGSESSREVPLGARLIDLAPEIKDFADTAAIVANLDLVISIDSAVAHLAGAMGKPVWILLNKGCDWRWFLNRKDSPWYPGARLFRQTKSGEWKDVVDGVGDALRQAEALACSDTAR